MLTKDQREILDLKYIRIVEAFETEMNNFIHWGMRGKADLNKTTERKKEFFAYLDTLTEK